MAYIHMLPINIAYIFLIMCMFQSCESFNSLIESRSNGYRISMGPLKAIKSIIKGGNKVENELYNYIIVGGGTAGCVLANRLSLKPENKVLLVEAGTNEYKNKLIQIPAGVMKLFKSKFDWNYESIQEPSSGNRNIYLCRGKVLGGSSCTNVLLYHRGDSKDYKSWADATGNETWTPENVLPYFKKSEDHYDGESKFHGIGGEYAVSQVPYQNPLSKAFLNSCSESGYSSNDDFNNWSRSQEGYGRYDLNQKNGVRCSAASGFLQPALKRKNLTVVSSSTVNKIIFDGKQTVGLEITVGDDIKSVKLAQNGEVLLTAGAIGSPQILMLSGVGPEEHLKAHNIDVVQSLPGVGCNLQDHPAALVSYQCSSGNEGISISSKIHIKGTKITSPKVLMQWLLRGSGPLTSTACDHGGFFKTHDNLESPNLQMRFISALALSADGMNTLTKFSQEANNLIDGFTFQAIAARPESRGSVKLRSNDASDKPLIDVGYLTSKEDVETMVSGVKLARKLSQTDAFKKYVGKEVYPGEHVKSDKDIEQYVRSTIHTSNAIVGTCKMGSDSMSVVDGELKVHGLRGLRVVDASIMPKIPGGQTGAPTIMIAEKAADLILYQ